MQSLEITSAGPRLALLRALFPSCAALAACPACGPGLPEAAAGSSVTVATDDGRPLDAASRAPRLQVRGLDPDVAVAGMRLFAGEVSSYANGRLRRGEVISAIEGREVPLSVWSTSDATVASPAQLLNPGESYSLAVLERGVIASFAVAEEELPVLRKVWPPYLHPRGELVYCLGESTRSSQGAGPASWTELGLAEPEGGLLELAPSGVAAGWRAGIGAEQVAGDSCVTLTPRQELSGGFVVPPQELSGALLDPAPTALLSADTVSGTATATSADDGTAEASCAAEEVVVVDACGRFDGTELVILPREPSIWFLRGEPSEGGPNVSWWGIAEPASPITVQPFEPSMEYDLVVHRFDGGGRWIRGEVRARSGEPRPRVVINEVLPDPLGPEPQGEWIELVNVGAAPALLEGWSIEDGGGSTPLPAVELPPGGFGLVVGRDYSAAAGDDVIPLPETLPIVVERVGQRGLANGGEPLRLLDAAGQVVSAVPALAARKAGISVARRDPWSSDDASAFGPHGAPGASPGGPNLVD